MSPGAARVKEEPPEGSVSDHVQIKKEADRRTPVSAEQPWCLMESAEQSLPWDTARAPHESVKTEPTIAGAPSAVKEELVLGPEGVQPRHVPECRHSVPAVDRGDSNRTTKYNYEIDPICDLCGRLFAWKSELLEHAMAHIYGTAKQESDDAEFSLPGHLWRWARLVPRDCRVCLQRCAAPLTAPPQRTDQNVKNTYMCDICSRLYTKKSNLIRHINQHMGKQKTRNVPKIIHKHNRSIRYPHTCVCKKEFTRLKDLVSHIGTKNGGKLYRCDKCKRQFKTFSSLIRHKVALHGADMRTIAHLCEICNKRFKHSSLLKNHSRIHLGENTFTCNICKRKYDSSTKLKRHMAYSHSMRTHKCEVCDKLFVNSASLQVHSRVHTGEKPYFCEVCNKTFTQCSNLVAHKRIHTGEKPYPCEICKKGFRKLTDLYRHIRTHTQERPHCCEICERKFSRLAHLKDHLKRNTHKNAYNCETCSKQFYSRSTLSSHKNRDHPETTWRQKSKKMD